MEDTIAKENTNAPVREEDGPRINEEIRVKEVRLIDENGENRGVISIREALQLAVDAGLDLIEISPQAVPPVCKILDFGKYKYEMQKRKAEAKKNQKVIEIKELKLRPMIDTHDYEVKIKQAKKFLGEGNKVKFTMRFKGREMNTSNLGQDVLHRILDDLEGLYKLDSEPKMEGRQMNDADLARKIGADSPTKSKAGKFIIPLFLTHFLLTHQIDSALFSPGQNGKSTSGRIKSIHHPRRFKSCSLRTIKPHRIQGDKNTRKKEQIVITGLF